MSVIRMQIERQSATGRERRRHGPSWSSARACRKRIKIAHRRRPPCCCSRSLFWWFAPSANSQTVAAERLTISAVEQGHVRRFPAAARAGRRRWSPSILDAVEGGRVEKVLVEDGAMVQQGQLLAVLSNADLAAATCSPARPRSRSRSTRCAARSWRCRRPASPTSARSSRPSSTAAKAQAPV